MLRKDLEGDGAVERAMLAGPVKRVAQSLLDPGEWADAMFRNSPWTFALEPAAA